MILPGSDVLLHIAIYKSQHFCRFLILVSYSKVHEQSTLLGLGKI